MSALDRDPRVNDLRLPTLLVSLLNSGGWRHPGDDALHDFVPWFEDPLNFLTNVEWMQRETRSLFNLADDERSARLFRQTRGSSKTVNVELPWLDVERAILIAVNRIPGDDVAMALDYRTDADDPRVVASDFWTNPKQCSWRIVTSTFSQFVQVLGLT